MEIRRTPESLGRVPAGYLDPSCDPSGRDRMARNVLTSWACHFVFIIAGFIVPRLIDRHLGQTLLGVWDLGWSVVSYLTLLQLGIVSSVNRYVARYRAAGDVEGINRVVSSVTGVLIVIGGVLLALSVVAAFAIPHLFRASLGEHTETARWVILFLGMSVVVELGAAGIGGVVTGFQRWDLHNAIHAGSHVFTVVGMIVLLWLGYGLVGLALMKLIGETLGRWGRCLLAYRIFPALKVRRRLFHKAQAREMMWFGGKTFVPETGAILLGQLINLILIGFLGPVMLAIYARPVALVHHVTTLANKLGMVLTPAASALQVTGRRRELRDLGIRAIRFAGFFAIPILLLLAIQGDTILRIWMGPRYTSGGPVLAILALGSAALIVHRPGVSILMGLNAHGRPGLAMLAASVCSVILAFILIKPLGLGLIGAAIAVALPQALVHGLYLPLRLCRAFDVSIGTYFVEAWLEPLWCGAVFGFCLLAARWWAPADPTYGLVLGLSVGTILLAVLYWHRALPAHLRARVLTALRFTPRQQPATGASPVDPRSEVLLDPD